MNGTKPPLKFEEPLKLDFVPGLNVIIGARGTGKTSLPKVIRHGLRAGGITEDAAVSGANQTIAILNGGQVEVIVNESSELTRYARSEDGDTDTNAVENPPFVILAQKELESIAAQPRGCLMLIDRFRPDRDATIKRYPRCERGCEA
jgi:hypothetical protein